MSLSVDPAARAAQAVAQFIQETKHGAPADGAHFQRDQLSSHSMPDTVGPDDHGPQAVGQAQHAQAPSATASDAASGMRDINEIFADPWHLRGAALQQWLDDAVAAGRMPQAQAELFKIQVGVQEHALQVETVSKVVEHATSATKNVLQTQT